ncbi:MAG TPA: tRNA (guanosine(46)-N7)-methyltransferase TrmB [Cyclobacteriaceae bacterium]|nr:tRNA (guanosine(46)-N7)-methyltransferase TrmB [Cyclobacteriaceae bacterium]HMV11003.1 tRNA (guanosine(46)-N7)-methyltransferase TrmB [Cyclobacteriaceae bacterium]HMV91754.1 tRNA (guanosine(46)-N7)-methyltransferase TrmB [Cyclobacteriaceae bacterium]HMX01832.1 tRNA (guanosine(46)-N7)-methyltransferase TrmB [Cyclobacteriaceae bacterium]HMX52169.1 tRNA (guanosine(46)-N7)-methyltransferase TrmB [Cyclobacteriaceae bacterium]
MKRKLERFKVIESQPNVVEPTKEFYHSIKGNWNKDFFRNDNPITVELACGRGEYTIGLAKLFPDRNYIGVDIKGERIWKGSTTATENNLTNAAFLRTMILLIENFFAEGEISEIWITFPDPRPRVRDIKRRLTSPRFLSIYKRLLKPGGYVRLKTDNTGFYEFTLEEVLQRDDITDLKFSDDVYNSELRPECFDIKTKYEQMFAAKGERIKYLRFQFK